MRPGCRSDTCRAVAHRMARTAPTATISDVDRDAILHRLRLLVLARNAVEATIRATEAELRGAEAVAAPSAAERSGFYQKVVMPADAFEGNDDGTLRKRSAG